MLENIKELELIWNAQKSHGLAGQMKLYTIPDVEPWRAKDLNLEIWFSDSEIDKAVAEVEKHYNNGKLPNSPLLAIQLYMM